MSEHTSQNPSSRNPSSHNPTGQAAQGAGTDGEHPSRVPLRELADELLAQAHGAHAGRAARTVYGGADHGLRQTAIALTAGSELSEHESPGEATLQVLLGQVRLTSGLGEVEAAAGDLVAIPDQRHALAASVDSVVLLTVRVR